MEQNIPRRKKEETQDKQKSSCRGYQPIRIDLIPMAVFYYHKLHTLYPLVPVKKSTKKGRKNRGSTRIFSQRESAESRASESFVASSTLSSLSLFFLFPSSFLLPFPSPPPFFSRFYFFPPIILSSVFYFIILYYYLSFVGYFGLSLLFGLFYLVLPLFLLHSLFSNFLPPNPKTSPPSDKMPYNTRRKSLSLPSLGIHLPNSSRRSPSLSKGTHATEDLPPAKKVKRSHTSLSPEPLSERNSALRASRNGLFDHTPPPSPLDGGVTPKIDTEGINDDIVVAVIDQLEKTGNRPHLVKELAAILVALNATVAKYVYSPLFDSLFFFFFKKTKKQKKLVY